MDIHSIRHLLKMKSIYDIPLRVTYYARVSSESDEQLNSLGNQITYYKDLIKRNRNWTFVPGYIDEGLSGISTKKRENFNRMIEEAAEDKFDLVITKEISRFARNTLDSIQFTRQLLSYGVGVFFQNDNINTLDEDSELRLSIMSSIAQDELRKLSSRVKFGHAQAIKDGVVLGNNRIFGYQKDNGRLIIDEDEAPMVRELFELYATGEYSMKQIEVIFWNKGYRNSRGNRLSHTTMSNMISNPKYKGYYVGNKVKVIDMFTKKQKFLPPEEWVMFKDESGEIVPAIVSEELWEKANAVLRKRSDDVKSRQGICNHANLLTGKLYCPCCGAAYYRRESRDRQGNRNSKWVCSGKIKNGADSCASFPIYEEEIKPLLFEVFKETEADAEAMLEEYLRLYQSLDSNGAQQQITAIEQKIDFETRKKRKLLDYNITGQITDQEYLQRSRECEQEIERLQKQLAELLQEQESKEDFRKHMESIRSVMRDAQRDAHQQIVSKEFIDKYIDRIFATPQEDGSLRLEIKIFTGEATEKYLNRLKQRAAEQENTSEYAAVGAGRTGHTFKLMNAAGYDLATLGNHEFDYAMEGTMNVIEWAQFPYVSANFYHEENGVKGENVLAPYKMFTVSNNMNIAFVGITTPESFTKSTPAYFQDENGNYIYGISGGEDGADLYADVQNAIHAATADGAHMVIALGHLGDDPASQPWTSEETIANVTGLSAFIDGHSHSTVEAKEIADKNGVPVLLTQTGEYFDRIGLMVISSETGEITTDFIEYAEITEQVMNEDGTPAVDEDGEEIFEVVGYEFVSDLYTGASWCSDEAVATIKNDWIAEIDTQLGAVIGSTTLVLDNYDAEGNRLVRSEETNTGDFAADALYYLFDNMGLDVDVAIMNGGGVRNKAITGDISYKTAKDIHTFGNVACLQTITGQQLLDALEWGARDAGSAECGGFLHVAGITYQIDTEWPNSVQMDDKGVWVGGPTGGYRVHDVKVYNKETNTWDDLDLTASYNLAGYNYTLRDLGDGFNMFDGAVNVLDYVMEDYMVLANYVQAFEGGVVDATNSPLAAKYEGYTVDYSTVNGSGRIVYAPAN